MDSRIVSTLISKILTSNSSCGSPFDNIGEVVFEYKPVRCDHDALEAEAYSILKKEKPWKERRSKPSYKAKRRK